MAKCCRPRVAALPTPAVGKRHRHSDDEHEKGLDQVPEPKSIPGMMMKLRANGADYCSIQLRRNEQVVNSRSLGYQEKHGESAKKIERHQPALAGERRG